MNEIETLIKTLNDNLKGIHDVLVDLVSATKANGNTRSTRGSSSSSPKEDVIIDILAEGNFSEWRSGNGYNFSALTKDGETIRCGAKIDLDIREQDRIKVKGYYSGNGENKIFWVNEIVSRAPKQSPKYESVMEKPALPPAPAEIPPSIDEDIPF